MNGIHPTRYTGESGDALRAHSTPEPDTNPPPQPTPDDVPLPANAPVEEPTLPEPPIRAG